MKTLPRFLQSPTSLATLVGALLVAPALIQAVPPRSASPTFQPEDGVILRGHFTRVDGHERLSLDNVQSADAGSYTVVASNTLGTAAHSLNLAVQERAPVVLVPPRSQTLAWGNNEYGQCNVPHDLRDVTAISAGGWHNLALVGQGPPRITKPPLSRVGHSGSKSCFAVEAIGAPPLRYQWRCNGIDILGATGCFLVLTNQGPDHAGLYSAVVRNNFGTAVSPPALLSFEPSPPVLLSQPVGQAVQPCGTATLHVIAASAMPVSYQWWQHQSDLLAGETRSILVLSNIQPAQLGDYFVTVNNAAGAVTSHTACISHGAVDSDADGLSDGWEQTYRLDPGLPDDGALDPDNDGMSNLAEFGAGTDPYDAASALHLETTVSNQIVWLRFTANAGFHYQVEKKRAVSALDWQRLAWVHGASAPPVREVTVTDPAVEAMGIYRAQAWPSSQIALSPSGPGQLTFAALAGYAYAVEFLDASDSLAEWQPLQWVRASATETITIHDPDPRAGRTYRWRRLDLPPPPRSPGDLDPTFSARISHRGYVEALAQEADGRFYVAGYFDTVNGLAQPSLARLWPNGAVDTNFVPVFSLLVNTIALQSDGRLLINRGFSGVPSRVVRLDPDGNLDTNFTAYPNDPTIILTVQPDGKILVGGPGLVRLNPDGNLDETFGAAVDAFIKAMVALPDGRILIGGDFDTVNGIPRDGLARLNNDGTVDLSFNPVANPHSWINCLALLPDEKILIAGGFGRGDNLPRRAIARLNADGSLDTAFDPGEGIGPNDVEIKALAVEADGRVLIGGNFSHVQGVPRGGLARLNSDGSLDLSFLDARLSSDEDISIRAILIQGMDKALVGGDDPIGLVRVCLGSEVGPPSLPQITAPSCPR